MTVTATNAAGSAVFPNVYACTVVAGSALVSFAGIVRPLLTDSCGSCHSFTAHSVVASKIGSILGRVQLTPGTQWFMPRGGSPLTSTQISQLQQWQAQGFPQ